MNNSSGRRDRKREGKSKKMLLIPTEILSPSLNSFLQIRNIFWILISTFLKSFFPPPLFQDNHLYSSKKKVLLFLLSLQLCASASPLVLCTFTPLLYPLSTGWRRQCCSCFQYAVSTPTSQPVPPGWLTMSQVQQSPHLCIHNEAFPFCLKKSLSLTCL